MTLSLAVFGQTEFEIYGKVFALDFATQDTLWLKNANVYVDFRDSTRTKQTTNERGEYRFQVKESNRPTRLYAKANSQTYNKERTKYCFIADGLYTLIPTTNHSNFIVNFEFKHVTDCGPLLPELIFQLNSYHFDNLNDSIKQLVSKMQEFPFMKVQINGHADSQERRPYTLSKKRAKQVYRELLKDGIDKSRLSYKGFGDKQILISEQIIGKASSNEEKLALRQKNTRVTFQIIEFGIE